MAARKTFAAEQLELATSSKPQLAAEPSAAETGATGAGDASSTRQQQGPPAAASHVVGATRQGKGVGNGASWRERLEDAVAENWARLVEHGDQLRCNLSEQAVYVLDDAIHWLSEAPASSVQAIVTDPPYSLIEYSRENLQKKRSGRGGVWRIPPSFDVDRFPASPSFPRMRSRNSTAFSAHSPMVRFVFSCPGGTCSWPQIRSCRP